MLSPSSDGLISEGRLAGEAEELDRPAIRCVCASQTAQVDAATAARVSAIIAIAASLAAATASARSQPISSGPVSGLICR